MGEENKEKEVAKPKDEGKLNEILRQLDILSGYFSEHKEESKEGTVPKAEINEEISGDK
jgi:hypothetical protein